MKTRFFPVERNSFTNIYHHAPTDRPLEELFVDGLLHEDPPRGDAVLPLVEEDAAQRVLHGLVKVAVGEDDLEGEINSKMYYIFKKI